MENINLEVVIDEDKFEGRKGDAERLVEEFLAHTDESITAKDGNISGYGRKSEIWWISIAILVISNPEGVLQFIKWASDIPGLKMGFTVEGNERFKLFSENAFLKIDNSTEVNINVNEMGRHDGTVVAKIPEEDWIELVDAVHRGDLDIDMPPEDWIGL